LAKAFYLYPDILLIFLINSKRNYEKADMDFQDENANDASRTIGGR